MALTTVPVELANLDGAVTVNESSADVDFRVESNGNANMLFVDAGNNRVGIGTGSPTHEVTIGASGADAKRSFSIEGTNGSSQKSTFEIENDGENSVAKINFDTAGGTGTARMAIDGSGNVGINSTAPRIYTASFGSSDNVKHLTVKSASGSVLELAGASNSNGVGMGIVQFVNDSNDNNAANAGGKEIAMIMAQTVTSDTNTSSDSGGALRIFTKPEAGTTAERMRITSAGPIGIGKEYVTAGVGSAPHGSLLVGNTAANDYAMSIHNIANSAAAYGMQMTAGANDGSGTTYYIYAMDGDRTGVGQIANVSGTFALADLILTF